jgi:hypothetical protein
MPVIDGYQMCREIKHEGLAGKKPGRDEVYRGVCPMVFPQACPTRAARESTTEKKTEATGKFHLQDAGSSSERKFQIPPVQRRQARNRVKSFLTKGVRRVRL